MVQPPRAPEQPKVDPSLRLGVGVLEAFGQVSILASCRFRSFLQPRVKGVLLTLCAVETTQCCEARLPQSSAMAAHVARKVPKHTTRLLTMLPLLPLTRDRGAGLEIPGNRPASRKNPVQGCDSRWMPPPPRPHMMPPHSLTHALLLPNPQLQRRRFLLSRRRTEAGGRSSSCGGSHAREEP